MAGEVEQNAAAQEADDSGHDRSQDSPPPPPLPPRTRMSSEIRPKLQSKPTTAVSSVDIQTISFPDGSRGTFSTAGARSVSTPQHALTGGYASPSPFRSGLSSGPGSDLEESMSVISYAPTGRPPGDLASLVAGELNKKSPAWMLLRAQSAAAQPFETLRISVPGGLANFDTEFSGIPGASARDITDDERLMLWRSKLKHYMILSSAGKPIYSRHGDMNLFNSYMGVVQAIISFYESAKNPLLGFTAGNARFVFLTEGPLYFLAISRLGESDAQLRDQLKALYMQILSTLTLPRLTSIFANRPSTDLRKPLEGTESLLSSLADTFTRGSASSLLGALECLRLRKSHRHSINNAFLKCRTDKLLYGLIAADGKLVSVIRPRRHSLHPSDLELIFNMLFSSGGIKSGGGESWIPLCLPAFNNSGYLYMYVSFFDADPKSPTAGATNGLSKLSSGSSGSGNPRPEHQIAIILISPDRESFYELKAMRDKVAAQLTKNGGLTRIREAIQAGRPQITAIAPGAQMGHFLYKSRANVQFCMSSLEPTFGSDGNNANDTGVDKSVAHRRLMTLYHQLHAALHARHSHLKVLHCVGEEAASLGWVTPIFEFYCVAGAGVSRVAMTQGANKIVQWAKKEEERLFIVGGGVF
jgi:vacuolar fusion protein MON1